MLSNQQFERTRRLALSLAGIELAERHRELLAHRSQRLGIANGAGIDSLLGAAESGDAAATRRLLCLLTTKFTSFFRHPVQFGVAARHALQKVHQGGRARLWSAGAATGEEPYSLAMQLIEVFQSDDPPVSILATELDAEALATAQRGEYSEAALRTLHPARRERFLRQTRDARRWGVSAALRRLVEFRVVNLAGAIWSVAGSFDVIFCRNVLMYLETCRRYAVLQRMASLLAPDGLLILDPTEHLGRAEHLFAARADGVYSGCPSPRSQRRLAPAGAGPDYLRNKS